MSQTEMTAEEMFESLNGFEEIAIAKNFDHEVTWLSDAKPLAFLRSLVFCHYRRGDTITDAQAKEFAMVMTLKEVEAYFAADPEDVIEDEPESESGKGE